MKKTWEHYRKQEEEVRKISNEFQISETLATILVNRNIIDQEKNKDILKPD